MSDKSKQSIFKDKNFWIGLGIGSISTSTITGLIVHKVTKKKERELANKEIIRKINEAQEKMQIWLDENVIEVDGDTPEERSKALEARLASSDVQEPVKKPEAVKTALEGQRTAYPGKPNISTKAYSDDDKKAKTDDIYAEPGTLPKQIISEESANKVREISKQISDKVNEVFEKPQYSGRKYQVTLPDGGVLTYPIELFCDKNGMMEPGFVRANLRDYETNIHNLKRIWEAFGWGEYSPDPEEGVPSAEEINNFELDIDDISDSEMPLTKELEEVEIEKQRYLDKVERYIKNPSTGAAKIVSKRRFDEDNKLEHIYVDYYDVDNVFTDNLDMNSEIDPVQLFGVANGKELFDYKAAHLDEFEDDDQDLDIVHVENFADNSIAEITRYHRSYQSVRDGSAYFDGGTGENGGT